MQFSVREPYAQRSAPAATPSPLWGQASGAISGLQNFANNAPAVGNAGAPQSAALSNLGSGLATAFQGNLPYANQALSNAFDPNQSIYNQNRADLTDATRAGEAARGIAMSPYGASVEGNVLGRFQNDWMDRSVSRQNMGANTAATLQGQYTQGVLGGGSLINQSGQLDQNNAAIQLQRYGLQGQQLQAAIQALNNLIGQSIAGGKQFIPGSMLGSVWTGGSSQLDPLHF